MATHAFSNYEEKQDKVIGNANERFYHTDSAVLAQITQVYRNQLKLTINGLSHASTFQQYKNLNTPAAAGALGSVTARICDPLNPAFAALVDAGGNPDVTKLNAVRNGVTDAIRPNTTTTASLNKIENEIRALDSLLKAPHRKFSNEDIAGYLTTKKKEGVEAIKAQHKKEVESITNYFDKTPPPGLSADDNSTALKTEVLAKLAIEQREQITNFENDLDKSINTLNNIRTDFHNMQAVESQRLFGDKAMRDAINAKAQAQAQAGPVSLNSNGRTISIDGLKLSDIKDRNNQRLLHCFSGRNVRITKDKDGNDAKLEIDISRWLGAGTIIDRYRNEKGRKSLTGEFTNTAQALKAQGFENITCTANHPDPATEKLIARCEYEGALRGGFDKDKIKLKLKDKDVKPEELFSPEELRQIYSEHDKRVKTTHNILGPEKAADSKVAQAAVDKAVKEIVENGGPAIAPPVAAGP